jgi:hypothetical protein
MSEKIKRVRVSKEKKQFLLHKLNHLEVKYKRTPQYSLWDNKVKDLLTKAGAYSFEALIHNDVVSVEMLITEFKDIDSLLSNMLINKFKGHI